LKNSQNAGKFKKAAYSGPAKAAAFVLASVMFAGFVMTGLYFAVTDRLHEAVFYGNYIAKLERDGEGVINYKMNLRQLLEFRNEEYIQSGDYSKARGDNFVTERAAESQTKQYILDFRRVKNKLETAQNIYYYAAFEDIVYANREFSTAGEFRRFQYNSVDYDDQSYMTGQNGEKYVIYVAYDNNYIASRRAMFEAEKTNGEKVVLALALFFGFGVLLFIYLVAVCGRELNPDGGKKNDIKLSGFDRLWTDFNLGLTVCAGLLFLLAASFIFSLWNSSAVNILENKMFTYGLSLAAVFISAVILALLLSIVRHIKNGTVFKHSFIYFICEKIFGGVGTLAGAASLGAKTGGIIAASLMYVYVFSRNRWMLAVFGAAAVFFAVKYFVKPFNNIQKGVKLIVGGDYSHTIDIENYGELGRLSDDINKISQGLKSAVNKEIKAERLKTELITNVSHDLKTPLTSIINYADLLSKETLTPDFANGYASIIKEKSEKLKSLTENLFVLSKAQSGNIPVNIEGLDIGELIHQTIAEIGAENTNNIEFRLNIENIKAAADGKLLSRVFENLILNITKYSLFGTRAYIDSFARKGKVHITFKNIANYEMNFEASDISERFRRGDESRSTDGNGLGLAIAQSYTEAVGGRFEITVDGDLFKVEVVLDEYNS
jgi:signal transduction histidine kinase